MDGKSHRASGGGGSIPLLPRALMRGLRRRGASLSAFFGLSSSGSDVSENSGEDSGGSSSTSGGFGGGRDVAEAKAGVGAANRENRGAAFLGGRSGSGSSSSTGASSTGDSGSESPDCGDECGGARGDWAGVALFPQHGPAQDNEEGGTATMALADPLAVLALGEITFEVSENAKAVKNRMC